VPAQQLKLGGTQVLLDAVVVSAAEAEFSASMRCAGVAPCVQRARR